MYARYPAFLAFILSISIVLKLAERGLLCLICCLWLELPLNAFEIPATDGNIPKMAFGKEFRSSFAVQPNIASSPSNLSFLVGQMQNNSSFQYSLELSFRQTENNRAYFKLSDTPGFLLGVLTGLAIHESGHFLMDEALGTSPFVEKVNADGFPFFALTYKKKVSKKEEYEIASAGFWTQNLMAEWILYKYPHVWKDAPNLAKGAFAFHIITSFIYSYAALTKSGPDERDTLGMADGLGIDERLVGAAILIPALLDLHRSIKPGSKLAIWSSRAFKISLILAVFK